MSRHTMKVAKGSSSGGGVAIPSRQSRAIICNRFVRVKEKHIIQANRSRLNHILILLRILDMLMKKINVNEYHCGAMQMKVIFENDETTKQ